MIQPLVLLSKQEAGSFSLVDSLVIEKTIGPALGPYTAFHKQKRNTEGCSKLKSPETRQVQERLVSTLEHMQVSKWDRTRCPEE